MYKYVKSINARDLNDDIKLESLRSRELKLNINNWYKTNTDCFYSEPVYCSKLGGYVCTWQVKVKGINVNHAMTNYEWVVLSKIQNDLSHIRNLP